MCKLSIITINYNNIEGLRTTIESVVNQSSPNFEYIIIDGGSTDGSKEVIESYDDKITYWKSEVDNGVYHAMNKGIRVAKGEYLLFLNSGDYFLDNSILYQVNNDIINEDFIYFNVQTENSIWKYTDQLDYWYFMTSTICHQSTFIRRSLFDQYGLYNENNKIVSDWEFFFKCIVVNRCSYKQVKEVLIYFDLDGVSNDVKNKKLSLEERFKVLKQFNCFNFDEYLLFREKEKDYQYYNKSRVVQLFKRLQYSDLYKRIRGLK